VTGPVTSLQITPGIGDVLPQTFAGSGSISVSPIGEQTYNLILNGTSQKSVSVVGLPVKNKLYIYLLMGQSNMQGGGSPFNATLDAAHPRVVKFGSRNGMEQIFVKGGHQLVMLTSKGGGIGMGVEFGKTIIAAQTDPEVVVCLINHAIGSSAIQWWAPGVVDNKQVNSLTGKNFKLYDEIAERAKAAANYGVVKGVLWHQGEYNSTENYYADPPSDPQGYAARLQALVNNLRNSFSNPSLPFVCGKFVPAKWVDNSGDTVRFPGLPNRDIVEAALMNLPNQVSNTFCVDNNGLRGHPDNLIHFDAASQRELGRRYAAAMLSAGVTSLPANHNLSGAATHQWGYRSSSNYHRHTIQFTFDKTGPNQKVAVYNLNGSLVGTYEAQGGIAAFNGFSAHHEKISPGIYLARITNGRVINTETIRVSK
jgi:hypothetical protein